MAAVELAVLKTLFSKVSAWGWYESENPVRAIRFRKEPRTRLRILESDEETRLLAVAPEPLRTIIVLGLNTGLRRSEMLTLLWDDVNLNRRTLTIQAAYAKNGRTRTVPLNMIVREALALLRSTSNDGLMFPGRQGKERRAIQTPFQHACERAGIKGVTLHTLRHSFASRLVLAGVDLRTVQELGGWQTIAMVERYSHLTQAHKSQAVEKLAGFHNAIHNAKKETLLARL